MIFLVVAGLVLSATAATLPRDTAIDVVLQAPSAPPEGHNVVDASFQSYSIEFSYMLDYAGNKSYVMAKNPNLHTADEESLVIQTSTPSR